MKDQSVQKVWQSLACALCCSCLKSAGEFGDFRFGCSRRVQQSSLLLLIISQPHACFHNIHPYCFLHRPYEYFKTLMAGRPKSKTKKNQLENEEKERVMQLAITAYTYELDKPEKERKGSRSICKTISAEYLRSTGKAIKLDHNTLLRRVNGGKSLPQANAEKSWLSHEEAETVVKFAEELSDRGIPLTHKTLEEHVNFVLTSKHGNKFPGVGLNWADRFLERHSDRLKTFFSSPLESSRARAANPATHKMFFDILERVMRENNIEFDCIYAADETGFMPGRASTAKVIGRAERKTQHRKESGNRQLITVMPTICADGSTIPPLVIFAGAAYLVSWKQNNPLKAS